MQRDMEAYETVTRAYKMPKGTEAEKQARQGAIQEALGQAVLVPLKSTKVALEALEITAELGNIASPNLLSDVAVAAILGEATFAASRENVEVNLKSMSDKKQVENTRRELDEDEARARRLRDDCLRAVRARCGQG